MAGPSIPRCPTCHSSAVRKREMIVKTGTYCRIGGSTGFSSKSPFRVFGSRGRNNWIEELMPMTYLWPVLMSITLYAVYSNPEGSVSVGFWIAAHINVLWFMAVHGDHQNFRNQWACSKCGEIWDPSE